MIEVRRTAPSSDWRGKELLARRWIEDQGFIVHDANIVFGMNCPNIDLIVYGRQGAIYVQTKSSENPAGADSVVIDGSPWTEQQLYEGAPIFNKHDHFRAAFVVLVDTPKSGDAQFYLARPQELETLVREGAIAFADKPKRDGSRRSIKFRKELPRNALTKWLGAWQQLGEPLHSS